MLDVNIVILYYTPDGILTYNIKLPNTKKPKTPLQFMIAKDGHYDVVYSKTYIKSAGICQSILFDVLKYNKLYFGIGSR